MKFMRNVLLMLLVMLISGSVQAQKKTQSKRTGALSPEEQLKKFKLKEGFIIELVASEKDGVINPIDLTFDDAGRLWTQTARMYPLDPMGELKWKELLKAMESEDANKKNPAFQRIADLYKLKQRGEDKILVIDNSFSPNVKKKVTVWAEGLSIPQSILPYKNGAFVAHGSEMLYLSDTNGDGKSDKHETVLTGFGFVDTHTMSHALVRAPGGWVNFSHGALNKGLVTAVKSGRQQRVDYCKIARFSLDGTKIELVGTGRDNIWGFQLRANGQWYGTMANDGGLSVIPMESQTGVAGIGGEKLRPYQPMFPPIHSFRVGGTGISGLAFSEDKTGSFPAEWKDVALLANPITSEIDAVKIKRNADGSVTAKLLEDLLKCDDDWFRPVNIEFGPDGCLYIADWYNKIISHNELSRSHPDRDKSHGRIWRIRHKSQKPVSIKNYYSAGTQELLKGLQSPSIWEKRAAWHQIADRQAMELVYPLVNMAKDSNLDETTRIMALWSLESLSYLDIDLMASLLKEQSEELQREAVRALTEMEVSAEQLSELLKGFEKHKNPMVRSEVLRTIADRKVVNQEIINILVAFCQPSIKGKMKLGGIYEREFERFLARKALELFPNELNAYLKSDLAKTQAAENLAWASEALSARDREVAFLKKWQTQKNEVLSESAFLSIAEMLRSAEVYAAVKDTFIKQSALVIKLALKNQAAVQSDAVSKLLKEIAQHVFKDSKDASLKSRAIVLVDRYSIKGLDSEVAALLAGGNLSEKDTLSCIKIFEPENDQQIKLLVAFLNSPQSSAAVKEHSLKTLVKAGTAESKKSASVYFSQNSADGKKRIIRDFSTSFYGSVFILGEMLKDKSLEDLTDYETALRLSQFNQGNDYLAALVKRKKAVQDKIDTERKNKISKFVKFIETKKGNAAQGKALFEALCLSCHSVGGKGAGFAPPLDGSAHRDNHGLLTSILDPDAAVESNYFVFKVTKKDGSTVEGYCEKQDERGVMLRFMGGAKLFIPASDIAGKGFVFGKSVMPAGLIDNMADAQVADILAYIKSLK